jgi:HD-like signal output (HDOD) protein/prolyl-tRNA editing enzyme YbaK/EbsC (Cys-tRNA(Pro) deacylase)
MSIAAKVKRFLDAHRICYRIQSHERTNTLCDAAEACKIAPQQFLRTVLLRDVKGIVAVILPLDSKLNFFALRKLLRRNLQICKTEQIDKLFCDCEPGSHPPITEVYGLLTVVDEQLFKQPDIYFEPGTHTSIVQIKQDDFCFLMSNAIRGPVSVPLTDDSAHCHWDRQEQLKNFCPVEYGTKMLSETILSGYNFDSPKVVQQIIELAKEQHSDEKELASILQSDPLLSQGLKLFAQLQSERNHENNVELCESIKSILDFNTVTHIAVGCTASQDFRVTKEGPLGLKAYWTHALNASQICYSLAKREDNNLCPTNAYLSGLFQNIGFLLYGHLFPPEFRLLNKWVKMSPKKPITLLEQRLLGLGQAQLSGCSHAQMGGWLMEKWGLPESVVVSTYRHHEVDYRGEYKEYILLLQAVNHCLLEFGMGEGQGQMDWNAFHDQLSLNFDDVFKVTQEVVAKAPAATLFK